MEVPRIFALTIILCLLQATYISCSEAEEHAMKINRGQNLFTELTDSSYESFKKDNEFTLISYYESYCTFCYKEEFENTHLSQKFKEHKPPVKLAMIDIGMNPKVGEIYKADALPILKLYNYEVQLSKY